MLFSFLFFLVPCFGNSHRFFVFLSTNVLNDAYRVKRVVGGEGVCMRARKWKESLETCALTHTTMGDDNERHVIVMVHVKLLSYHFRAPNRKVGGEKTGVRYIIGGGGVVRGNTYIIYIKSALFWKYDYTTKIKNKNRTRIMSACFFLFLAVLFCFLWDDLLFLSYFFRVENKTNTHARWN